MGIAAAQRASRGRRSGLDVALAENCGERTRIFKACGDTGDFWRMGAALLTNRGGLGACDKCMTWPKVWFAVDGVVGLGVWLLWRHRARCFPWDGPRVEFLAPRYPELQQRAAEQARRGSFAKGIRDPKSAPKDMIQRFNLDIQDRKWRSAMMRSTRAYPVVTQTLGSNTTGSGNERF